MLARCLILDGHRVTRADNAETAMELARHERPEVAILDIGLPGANGFKLARALRIQSWGRDMLIVALGGGSEEHERERAMEAGFDHHLGKPVRLDQLDVLMRGLKKRPARR